jgi:hypothetical protein
MPLCSASRFITSSKLNRDRIVVSVTASERRGSTTSSFGLASDAGPPRGSNPIPRHSGWSDTCGAAGTAASGSSVTPHTERAATPVTALSCPGVQ